MLYSKHYWKPTKNMGETWSMDRHPPPASKNDSKRTQFGRGSGAADVPLADDATFRFFVPMPPGRFFLTFDEN